MINTPTRSTIQRFVLANRAVDVEERLPISDGAQNGLSSLWIGLVGSFVIAAVIAIVTGFHI